MLEGAFNINSTSVDAWIAQLSSLRGKPIPNDGGSSFETPFPRFLNQPEENTWNKIRFLTDDEITLLAHCLIEQIKLRGPFLSFSDFTNRRLIGTPVNLIPKNISTWKSFRRKVVIQYLVFAGQCRQLLQKRLLITLKPMVHPRLQWLGHDRILKFLIFQ